MFHQILNAGISNKSYEVPASGTPEIINITKSSNVERPGVWVFRIDGDEIPSTNLMTEGKAGNCYNYVFICMATIPQFMISNDKKVVNL